MDFWLLREVDRRASGGLYAANLCPLGLIQWSCPHSGKARIPWAETYCRGPCPGPSAAVCRSIVAHAVSARDPTVLLTSSFPKASPENPADGLDPDATFSWCASGGFAIGMQSWSWQRPGWMFGLRVRARVRVRIPTHRCGKCVNDRRW